MAFIKRDTEWRINAASKVLKIETWNFVMYVIIKRIFKIFNSGETKWVFGKMKRYLNHKKAKDKASVLILWKILIKATTDHRKMILFICKWRGVYFPPCEWRHGLPRPCFIFKLSLTLCINGEKYNVGYKIKFN